MPAAGDPCAITPWLASVADNRSEPALDRLAGWRRSARSGWSCAAGGSPTLSRGGDEHRPEVRRYLGPVLTFEQAEACDTDLPGRPGPLRLRLLGRGSPRVRRVHRLHRAATLDEGMPSPVPNSAGGSPGRRGDTDTPPRPRSAAVEYGFDGLGLPEIVAVTMAANLRSRAVMRRIGMTTDPVKDFDDPDVEESPAPPACAVPETTGSCGIDGLSTPRIPLLLVSLSRHGLGVYPARAGGPWLCSTLVRSGFHAVVVPSGLSAGVQPHRWITTQCRCLTH